MKTGTLIRTVAAALVLIGAPASADAHLINTSLGDFYGGVLHPLSGPQDVVPWFALAILAAIQGPRNARWLLFVFPIALVGGALLSVVAPALPISPAWSLAVIVVTGLAVAAAAKLPFPVFLSLVTLIALLHGYYNGQAMTQDTDHFLFICGIAAVGYVFVTLITALAISFRQGGGEWRLIALRASGSWVAAVGIIMVGLQLRTSSPM
ncbi:HupE/UreJ family protein [Hyphomicrobium sp. 99]|uniref:HupE/UreJ family protein n=1 Tax=Hyphomicrobium sp. 99 TaxID=1163419 RepID=UPI0005F7E0F9|nr:HupE/UreJ family protein [Hyphomicrobium sp. 99]